MRVVLTALVLLATACDAYTYTEINEHLLRNAECECKDAGGLEWIAVRAANWPRDTVLDSFYNFKCANGLETGWWLYNGSMGTPPLINCEEE